MHQRTRRLPIHHTIECFTALAHRSLPDDDCVIGTSLGWGRCRIRDRHHYIVCPRGGRTPVDNGNTLTCDRAPPEQERGDVEARWERGTRRRSPSKAV